MSRLRWGPQWSGPAYRYGLSSVPSDVSAADVLRYEIEELGNSINFDMDRIGGLEAIPGNRLVWVTKTPEDAKRYGNDIEPVNLPRGSETIATDQEGGYLVLIPRKGNQDD